MKIKLLAFLIILLSSIPLFSQNVEFSYSFVVVDSPPPKPKSARTMLPYNDGDPLLAEPNSRKSSDSISDSINDEEGDVGEGEEPVVDLTRAPMREINDPVILAAVKEYQKTLGVDRKKALEIIDYINTETFLVGNKIKDIAEKKIKKEDKDALIKDLIEMHFQKDPTVEVSSKTSKSIKSYATLSDYLIHMRDLPYAKVAFAFDTAYLKYDQPPREVSPKKFRQSVIINQIFYSEYADKVTAYSDVTLKRMSFIVYLDKNNKPQVKFGTISVVGTIDLKKYSELDRKNDYSDAKFAEDKSKAHDELVERAKRNGVELYNRGSFKE